MSLSPSSRPALKEARTSADNFKVRLPGVLTNWTPLLDHLPVGIMLVSPDGSVVDANAAAARLLGLDEESLYASSMWEHRWRLTLVDGRPLTEADDPVARTLDAGPLAETVGEQVVGVPHGEGHWRWIEITARRVDDAEGGPLALVTLVNRSVQITHDPTAAAAHERVAEPEVEGDRLLATFAHDMATPLATVVGYAEMLLDGDFGGLDDDQAYAAGLIARNGARINELVDAMVDFDRARSGAWRPRPVETTALDLVEEAVAMVKPQADDSRVKLLWAASDVRLETDPVGLSRVLVNLLQNAVKYTGPGGTVSVHALREGNWLSFSVTDDGIGIPADDMARLFEPFFRARTAVEHDIPGTGLGLAIVHELTQMLGGHVHVESLEGHGSTFCVSIPLNQGANRAER